MSSTESFTTTSGKEITVNISRDGEPESIEFKTVSGEVIQVSENEILEIAEWLEDYEDDGNEDNDSEERSSESNELT